MIKVISLDFTDTIVDRESIDSFWLELIPRFYSKRHNISLDAAKRIVFRAYDDVGPYRIEWYLVDYWLRELCIDDMADEMFDEWLSRVHIYNDVLPSLSRLAREYTIVITTNVDSKLVSMVLKGHKRLQNLIAKVFSCVTDFRLIRKSSDFYAKVIETLRVSQDEVLHVGDDYVYDCLIPRSIGVNVVLIDRRGEHKSLSRSVKIIRSLNELGNILLAENCSA